MAGKRGNAHPCWEASSKKLEEGSRKSNSVCPPAGSESISEKSKKSRGGTMKGGKKNGG